VKSPDDIGREVAQTIRSWSHVAIPDGRPLGRVIAAEIRDAVEAARQEFAREVIANLRGLADRLEKELP
jgi:hypothetical protein